MLTLKGALEFYRPLVSVYTFRGNSALAPRVWHSRVQLQFDGLRKLHMEDTTEEPALFDEETGAPLNEAARRIFQEGKGGHVVQPAAGVDSGGDVLSGVAEVEIASGKWKYVTIELSRPGETAKVVVRSISGLKFHGQTFEATLKPLRSKGVEGKVLGGGRLEYYPGRKKINVYGYSKTFGKAPGNNKRTANILRKAFPQFTVDWSDSGY